MVVGLGNPEPRYLRNRHNVGFMVVDRIADGAEITWRNSNRFSAAMAIGALGGEQAVLVKPMTFMNLSGQAVAPIAHFYRVPAEQMVVIHDDVDLELGRLKLKQGGGDGGHNGLRSISELLGSSDYHRVRFGVGRPEFGEVADYVLSDFTADEQDLLKTEVKRAAKAVQAVIKRGIKEAMNRFNRTPQKKKTVSDSEEAPPAKSSADHKPISDPESASDV